MMTKVMVAEVRKTFGRRTVWGVAGAVAAFIALYFVLAHMTAQQAQVTGMDVGQIPVVLWPHGLVAGVTGLLGPGFVGGIAAVILASSVWAPELRWRTLHLWLSRGASRAEVLVAKAVVLILSLFVVAVVGTITSGGVSAGLTMIAEGGLDVGQLNGGQALLSVLWVTVALMPVALLTLLVGVLVRSAVGTVGIAVAYVILGEQLIGAVLSLAGAGDAARLLPVALASSLVGQGQSMVRGVAPLALPTGPALAFIGSLVWSTVLLGGAVVALRRQDLTG